MNHLLAFLKDWLVWAEAGGDEASPLAIEYFAECGLCSNANKYDDANSGLASCAAYLLAARFAAQGRNPTYPFGMEEYEYDQSNGTQHTNPVRLAWVRETIKELESQ